MIAILIASSTVAAHADGGRLQVRQTAGPFIVSLFSAPESLGVGPADLSAMVEERGGGRVLLDANVVITLTPQNGKGAAIVAHLSHAHSTDRLLQDVIVQLPHAGRWRAAIQVSQGGRRASAAIDLLVGEYSARRGTVWLFAMLPVCAIGLFAWVQIAKRPACSGIASRV